MRILYVLIGLLLCALEGRAQSFNVDLSIDDVPELGGGVPTDAFGGAANQPGRWNSVYVIGSSPMLRRLDGLPTGVSLSIASSNQSLSGGGFANLTNTGDFARLLNDVRYIDALWASWTFHGLTNGSYRAIVYAVRPFPVVSEARVSVNGGPTAFVFGPMPGNQLTQGITHSIHNTVVSNGTLTILVARNPNGEIAACNGFQITAVPEPTTILFLAPAFVGFVRRKRTS